MGSVCDYVAISVVHKMWTPPFLIVQSLLLPQEEKNKTYVRFFRLPSAPTTA